MKGWWLKHCLGGGAVCIIYCGEAVLHKLTDNRSPSRGGGRQYCVSGKLGGVCSGSKWQDSRRVKFRRGKFASKIHL